MDIRWAGGGADTPRICPRAHTLAPRSYLEEAQGTTWLDIGHTLNYQGKLETQFKMPNSIHRIVQIINNMRPNFIPPNLERRIAYFDKHLKKHKRTLEQHQHTSFHLEIKHKSVLGCIDVYLSTKSKINTKR
jgi:hypothetical protein